MSYITETMGCLQWSILYRHCWGIISADKRDGYDLDAREVDMAFIVRPKSSIIDYLAYIDELAQDGVISKKESISPRMGKYQLDTWLSFVFKKADMVDNQENTVNFDLAFCDADNFGYISWQSDNRREVIQYVLWAIEEYDAPFIAGDGYIWVKNTHQKLTIFNDSDFYLLLGIPNVHPSLHPHAFTLEYYQNLIQQGHKWGDLTQFPPLKKERRTFHKWTSPFLSDDGLVWVYQGDNWSKCERYSRDAVAQWNYFRQMPQVYEAFEKALLHQFFLWEQEKRLLQISGESIAVLRGEK